jgi:hypothetical protein
MRDKGVVYSAKPDSDGRYEVKTIDGLGCAVGTYQVSIFPAPMVNPPIPFPAFPNIPSKYRGAETSGLTLTVKEGDNPFDVDMKK